MAGSTSKKVVVHRFDRSPVSGYLEPVAGLTDENVELIDQDGKVARLPWAEVKAVCFVRDFEGPGLEREQRVFRNRPKGEGLWVRLQFRDNDFLEGMIANNLLQMDARGLSFSPPDASSNNPRIFAPRAALKECRVLGVIGAASARRKKAEPAGQPRLFE